MSNNLSSLRKRKKIIANTLKITQAMKLVSFSKFQTYSSKQKRFTQYYDTIWRIPRTIDEQVNKKIIVFLVGADLGLASAYMQALYKTVHPYPDWEFMVLGQALFDRMKHDHFKIVNDVMKSENTSFDFFLDWSKRIAEDYSIRLLRPFYKHGSSIRFEWVSLDEVLFIPYNLVTGEDVADLKSVYRIKWIAANLYQSYLACKMVEHTVRRTAMEQASENAEELLQHIDRQYNRLRQEKITQEINELIASMEG